MRLLLLSVMIVNTVYASLVGEIKPKFVEMDGYTISDKKQNNMDVINKTIIRIEKLLKEKDFLRAREEMRMAERHMVSPNAKGLMSIYRAKVLDAEGKSSEAKRLIEKEIGSGGIPESILPRSYVDLMRYSLNVKKTEDLKRYKSIVENTTKKDDGLRYLAQLIYAEHLIKRNNYSEANMVLDKILTETSSKEMASEAMFLKSHVEIVRGKKENASILLEKIYKNNPTYFLNRRHFISDNESLLWENRNLSIVRKIIADLSKHGNTLENPDGGTLATILQSKIYFADAEYLKSIETSMLTLKTPKAMSAIQISELTKNNDLGYVIMGIQKKEAMVVKYRNSQSMLNKIELADFKRMVREKNNLEMANNIESLIGLPDETFNHYYEGKVKYLKHISQSIVENFFTDYPSFGESSSYVAKQLDLSFSHFFANKKITNNILAYLKKHGVKKYNKMILEDLKEEKNLKIKRSEVELFLLEENSKKAISIIEYVLGLPSYGLREKAWFFTTLLQIEIVEGKPFEKLRDRVSQLRSYGVSPSDELDFLYNLYMAKRKVVGVKDDERESILYSMMNISLAKTNGLYRPFIDLELIEIQIDAGRLQEAEILLDNVVNKDSIRRDFKIRWLTLSGRVSSAVGKKSKARLEFKQCIILSLEDKISNTNCKMLLKTLDGEK